jgi:hypothetical protein
MPPPVSESIELMMIMFKAQSRPSARTAPDSQTDSVRVRRSH